MKTHTTARAWLRGAAALAMTALLAGTQAVGGAGQADGPLAQARLTTPQALAVAADGTVYIGQPDRVRRLDAQGVLSTVYVAGELPGDGDRPDGAIYDLGSLAIGPDGTVHVTARWWPAIGATEPQSAARPVVLRVAANGTASVAADPVRDGAEDGAPGWLSSMAFDQRGRLWLGDASRCRLWRAGAAGARWTVQRRTVPGGSDCVGFQSLQSAVIGLAAGPDGGMVYQLANGEVHRLLDDGSDQLVGLAAGGYGLVNRLALDRDGRVLLADPG